MKFEEINSIIVGYINYFNFMRRSNVEYFKNTHLKEIDIRKKHKKNVNKKLISFYLGDIKNEISIQIFEITDELMEEIKKKKIKIKDKKIKITSNAELHTLFDILERTNFM